ncbi:MAG: TlpA family protein disulfide reductase [Dehalococcoidia bacterium]|nr:TlpA family protein disulfide reductase [Dehalococcoidia bacterium]
MKKTMHTAVLAAVLTTALLMTLVFAAGCSEGESAATEYTPEELGLQEISVAAPDFSLGTLDGGQITLSSLWGTPVLLNFWQLNCPPCKEEMPYLEALATEYKGRAYILAIDLGDSEDSVRDYFGDGQRDLIVPLDTMGQAGGTYSVGFTPTTFLIDADGIVRYVKVGPFANEEQVSAAMRLVTGGA